MDNSKTITVQEEFDIISARMYARELARAIGFNLVDQARISLATSSSARALGVDRAARDCITITMERLGNDGRTGVRVICVKPNAEEVNLSSHAFSDMRRMVDELAVETLPPSDVQVTLIKWLN